MILPPMSPREIILADPILPDSPWEVLGFWTALRCLFHIYLHPWESQWHSIRRYRAAILNKL